MNELNSKQTHIENPWDVTSDNCQQPLYSVVDGDGSVSCFSGANDGMDAAARFEVRDVGHTQILFKPSVLLLISCIMGLKVLPKVQ
ncbi:MAG: hypothetical protein EZS28_022908 [Streblomastix strix]|uniref:Uncharacterized protein n=1 Tax=Streblomastix strix TaxID=222440 RepID=A0A5J4VGU3_9EUKA|nr:MAG: hypothetical protein EZS28_022908 [Streblomastix strix]